MRNAVTRITVVSTGPQRKSSIRELQTQVEMNHWGKLRKLPDGRFVVVMGYTSFMAVDYEVLVYAPHRSIFGKDQLKLHSRVTVEDDPTRVEALFKSVH